MIDVPIVDSHHHLARLDLGYPWLAADAPTDRYHGDDRSLRRDYLLADYLADVGSLPVVASVHVENGAQDPLQEARWIGDVIGEADGRPAVHVGRVDLAAEDAPRTLDTLAAMPYVCGVRHILNWHADPRVSHTDRDGIMEERPWRRNFARLAGLGLSFDLQVFSEQLPAAARLAEDHPETTIVLDHVGMPRLRDADYLAEWRKGLRAVARHPNVSVKISAIGTTDHRWTPESLKPVVLEAIDAFGPDRSMFGSNFPVDGMYSTFAHLYSTFDAITRGFGGSARRLLFGATAARVYRIDGVLDQIDDRSA